MREFNKTEKKTKYGLINMPNNQLFEIIKRNKLAVTLTKRQIKSINNKKWDLHKKIRKIIRNCYE